MSAESQVDGSPSGRVPFGFGNRAAAADFVSLDAVTGQVGGEIRCSRGNLVAKITKDPDVLYTGSNPVNLSDSVRVAVSVWDRVEGCPDQGLWEIDMGRLRPLIRWRQGKLRIRLADVARRPEED